MRLHAVFAVLALTGFTGASALALAVDAPPAVEGPVAVLPDVPLESVPALGLDDDLRRLRLEAAPGLQGVTVEPLAAASGPDPVASGVRAASSAGGAEVVHRLVRLRLLPDDLLFAAPVPDRTDAGAVPLGNVFLQAPYVRAVVRAPAAVTPFPSATASSQAAQAPPAGPPEATAVAYEASARPMTAAVAEAPAALSVQKAVGAGIAAAVIGLAGVALYHRIRSNAALENETRKVIFDAVCQEPGLGVQEIAKVARVSYSTATYHLDRLVQAGMLVMTPEGNKLRYYKNGGAFTETERKILPLVKNAEAARLFEAILNAPGTYRAALAERLGVTATTINWHLRRLREAGLVEETRQGRNAHLVIRQDVLRETFPQLAEKLAQSEPDLARRLMLYARIRLDRAPDSTAAGSA